MGDLLAAPFTTTEARARGLTTRDLRSHVDAGTLVRPFHGVYLPAEMATDTDERARAAGLLVPDGGALAREAAAWVHGVDVRPPRRFREEPVLDVVSDSMLALNAVRRPEVRGHLEDLPPGDVTVISGTPVTTPARTALDLARYTERYMGLAALDMFCHAGLVDLADVEDRVERLRGRRWIARARTVCRLADPRAESPGESWVRLRIAEARLPMPEVQIVLRDLDGREVFRLDMGYERELLAIEYDGALYHRATPEQQIDDESRRRAIEAGWHWRLRSFHAGHVLGRTPVVERVIVEALGLGVEVGRIAWL